LKNNKKSDHTIQNQNKVMNKVKKDIWKNLNAINIEERSEYLPDGDFYMLWKYRNGKRLGNRFFTFDCLTGVDENEYIVATKIFQTVDKLGGNLIDLKFQTDYHKKYCPKTHEGILKYIKKNKGNKQVEKIRAIIEEGNYDFLNNLITVSLFEKYKLLEWFEFSNKINKNVEKKLSKGLSDYIDKFIKDKLFIDDKNFYKFEKQKEIFLEQIKDSVENYGLRFIFKQGKTIAVKKGTAISIGEDMSYLFIHTLVALEKLGYLEVEQIWIFNMMTSPEEQTEDYKIRLFIKQKLIDEIHDKKIIINPADKSQRKKESKKRVSFDSDRSILYINEQKVKIQKFSNQYHLLRILFKDKLKDWYFSEITELIDSEKDFKWKNLYNSANEIRKKIAIETSIKDFFITTTQSIKINEKYLKKS